MEQTFVILTGLALAGWGHLLVHDLLGASAVWSRLDGQFPPALRSSPGLGGAILLAMGGLLVLLALCA